MKFLLWDSLNAFTKLYDDILQPVGEKYHLTRAELDILLFLANNPQYDRAADIIEVRKVAKSHVSASVKELLAKGYLKGTYDDGNQRDIHLHVTKKADSIISDGRREQDKFRKTIFNGMSQTEMNALDRSLQKLIQNAEQYYEDKTK